MAISSEFLFSSLQVLTTLPEGAMLEWVPTFVKPDLSNHRGYGLVSIYSKKFTLSLRSSDRTSRKSEQKC